MNLLRIAAGTLLASGLIAGSVVLPVSGDSLEYVAIGDSYAAGVGAGSYTEQNCLQSTLGYPVLLDQRKRIELVINESCTGDVVADAASVLGSLSGDTDLVTLTVGGNDVRYLDVIRACGDGPVVCEETVGAAVSGAQTGLATQLAGLYGEIKRLAPNAEVLVTGYPHLFSPEFGNTITIPESPLVLTPVEQQILNDGTDALNAAFRAQAEAAGFTYVDVVERFDGHGLGSPHPWIQPFTDPAALHPTAKGYKNGYLHEIRHALH